MMLRPILLAVLALAVAGPVRGQILLDLPVACTIGQDCYIQQYLDHDPGPGFRDFACGRLSYDTHGGTDFALLTLDQMAAGVEVLAAAPGTVRATRDGMPDIASDDPTAPDVSGRECGNGVVIDHGSGVVTQYCHLRRGSVAVRGGQAVAAGDVLGLVGLSGRTEFPHLEFILRQDDAQIDPFAPDGAPACGAAQPRGLWRDPLPAYRPGGIIEAGFAARLPAHEEIRQGMPSVAPPRDGEALVVWAHAYGGQPGDVMRFRLAGPPGVVHEADVTLEGGLALFFRATGRRTPPGGWPPGRYDASIALLRDGREIHRRAVSAELR